jgi:metal-sulfur cluster biosynthetic enzyme
VILLKNLERKIYESTGKLRDPETDKPFSELNIITDIKLEEDYSVKIIFTPNSPFSPIAVNIGLAIRNATLSVQGIKKVNLICQGHMHDEFVNQLVNKNKDLNFNPF